MNLSQLLQWKNYLVEEVCTNFTIISACNPSVEELQWWLR